MGKHSTVRDSLNIISSDEGKRYRLNIKGDVGRVTVGRVKECLATLSSCPIPLDSMSLRLNGVLLSNDDHICSTLGITGGTTLSVEDSHRGNDTRGGEGALLRSPRRHQLEIHALNAQEGLIEPVACHALQSLLNSLQGDINDAERLQHEKENHRAAIERELADIQRRKEAASRERHRLATLQIREEQQALERASELATRRELLLAEETVVHQLVQKKLENEKRKEVLSQLRAEYDAEKRRVSEEQAAYDREQQSQELLLRAREVECEQQILARARERKELELQRFIAQEKKNKAYEQLGLPVADSGVPLLGQRGVAICRSRDGQEAEGQTAAASTQAMRHGYVSEGSSSRSALPAGNDRSHLGNDQSLNCHSHVDPQRSLRTAVPPDQASAAGSSCPGTNRVCHRNNQVGCSLPLCLRDGQLLDAVANAEENLRRLGEHLGLAETLIFDSNSTCVISVDDTYTLLITFDSCTERLYLYSTLSTALPHDDPMRRLRLYELFLGESLLGREMCGGGVSASLKDRFVLLSTSLYLPTSHPWALPTIVPQFVQCLEYWREKLRAFVQGEEKKASNEGDTSCRGIVAPDISSMEAVQQPTPRGCPPPSDVGRDNRASLQSDGSCQQKGAIRSPGYRSHESAVHADCEERPLLGLEVTGNIVLNGIPAQYSEGVLVVNVVGPAALGGVLPHDFLREIGGVRVTSVSQFQELVQRLKPGELVSILVDRNGLPVMLAVKVGTTYTSPPIPTDRA